MDEAPGPRQAATVLLLRDDPLRVLLVQRPGRGAFPSVLAFPGGAVDAEDGAQDGTDAAARVAAVREVAEETGIALPGPTELVAWARWVTPPAEPRRFDTFFYAIRAPGDAEPRVDGVELVSARWAEPAEALRRRTAGEWPIIAPTAFNLLRLAESATVEDALRAARARPAFVVRPELELHADGNGIARVPAEAGYPVTELTFR